MLATTRDERQMSVRLALATTEPMPKLRQYMAWAVCLALISGCSGDPKPDRHATVPVAKSPTTAEQPAVVKETPPAVVYKKRNEGRYRESRFMRAHDMFISADSPQTVAADEATFLQDNDEVVGFVIDGQARAYSVRMLSYHHVINDEIRETPIAVTY